jgi:hypothetical protein
VNVLWRVPTPDGVPGLLDALSSHSPISGFCTVTDSVARRPAASTETIAWPAVSAVACPAGVMASTVGASVLQTASVSSAWTPDDRVVIAVNMAVCVTSSVAGPAMVRLVTVWLGAVVEAGAEQLVAARQIAHPMASARRPGR